MTEVVWRGVRICSGSFRLAFQSRPLYIASSHIYWIRHSHRTPSLKVSTFGSLLIKRAPLAFFVISTIAFSGGLVAFAFLAFGRGAIPKVAVICTSITIGSMVLVILWLASEKWELLLFKAKEFGANFKEGTSRWITVIYSLQVTWRRRPVPARSHASVSIPEDIESQYAGNAKGSSQLEMPKVIVSEAEPGASRYGQSPVDAATGTVLSPTVTHSPPPIPMVTLTGNQSYNEVIASEMHAEGENAPPRTILARQFPGTATSSLLPNLGVPYMANIGPSPTQRPLIHRDMSPPRRELFRFSVIKPALQHPKLGKCAFKLRPHPSAIRRIVFSPDGLFLASCAQDNSVKVWKLDTHLYTNPLFVGDRRESSVINDVVWCPDSVQPRFVILCGKLITLRQVEV